MKVKKSMIALGVVMGCFGVLGGMIYNSRNSEAAVAVWDQKNIAQAVQTVLMTTNILTEEQKKIALELLNLEKLDENRLVSILQGQINRDKQVWDEKGAYESILNIKKTPSGVWDEHLGKIDLILKGEFTPQDAAQIAITGIQLTEKTTKDAATVIQQTQKDEKQTQENMQKLLKDSEQAKGELQVQQAGNAMLNELGNKVDNTTRLMEAEVAMIATEQRRQAALEAKAHAEHGQYLTGMNSSIANLAGF